MIDGRTRALVRLGICKACEAATRADGRNTLQCEDAQGHTLPGAGLGEWRAMPRSWGRVDRAPNERGKSPFTCCAGRLSPLTRCAKSSVRLIIQGKNSAALRLVTATLTAERHGK